MTIKLVKNWHFWGIDINVFMGHLSTLSKVKKTHLALQKCIICQVATIGSQGSNLRKKSAFPSEKLGKNLLVNLLVLHYFY